MVDRPPTLEQSRIGGELRDGHTVAESLQYLAWCDDYAAQQRAPLPPGVISLQAEPRLITWARRVFRQ